jgi:uncharacterized cofD-like protein
MADDGGSSGMLRSRTGTVPPGDVRKCLVAMAEDPNSPWVKAFRQRFDYLNNHTLGNLILTTLESTAGSFTEAIALCERLLGARGRVLPSTLSSVEMSGITQDGKLIHGQSALCASKTALTQVSLVGEAAAAYMPACQAIEAADLVVLGPGSLFTSIIAALLAPGILTAVFRSNAAVAYVAPITDSQGETWGLAAHELTEALLAHGLRGRLDYVIANSAARPAAAQPGAVTAVFNAIGPEAALMPAKGSGYPSAQAMQSAGGERRMLAIGPEDEERVTQLGCVLVCRALSESDSPQKHSVAALARVFMEVMRECRSRQR